MILGPVTQHSAIPAGHPCAIIWRTLRVLPFENIGVDSTLGDGAPVLSFLIC